MAGMRVGRGRGGRLNRPAYQEETKQNETNKSFSSLSSLAN
jgi:hypothetical protein